MPPTTSSCNMLVCNERQVTYPPKTILQLAPVKPVVKKTTKSIHETQGMNSDAQRALAVVALFVVAVVIGFFLPPTFTSQLMIFALSVIVGYNSIWNVAPSLHTPLMSVTNAISGVVILGALFQANRPVRQHLLLGVDACHRVCLHQHRWWFLRHQTYA